MITDARRGNFHHRVLVKFSVKVIYNKQRRRKKDEEKKRNADKLDICQWSYFFFDIYFFILFIVVVFFLLFGMTNKNLKTTKRKTIF
jgi:hypothetical protein